MTKKASRWSVIVRELSRRPRTEPYFELPPDTYVYATHVVMNPDENPVLVILAEHDPDVDPGAIAPISRVVAEERLTAHIQGLHASEFMRFSVKDAQEVRFYVRGLMNHLEAAGIVG